jgi:hypothetical protein
MLASGDVGLGLVCQCIMETSQLGGLVDLLMSHIHGVGRDALPNLSCECLVGIGGVREFGADLFFRNPVVVLGLLIEVLSSPQEFVVRRFDGPDACIGTVELVSASFV